jgi:hypothetical protein
MRVNVLLGLLAIAVLASPCAFGKDSGWAVVGKAGSMGFGADIHRQLAPKLLNLRFGAGFFQISADFSNKDINYGATLKLGAVPIGVDVYPFKNWFRLEGGLLINLNGVDGTAKPNQGQIQINGHTYSADQVGQLNATLRVNRAAPFLGLGFGNPIKRGKHWGFTFDLGAMYHGHPKAVLSATKTLSTQLQSDLQQQQQSIENDAKKYTFFPIIQFGISYHFSK